MQENNSHGEALNTSETQENSNKNKNKLYILAYKIINQKLLTARLQITFQGFFMQ